MKKFVIPGYVRRVPLIFVLSTASLVVSPPMTLSSEAGTIVSVVEVDAPIVASGVNTEIVETLYKEKDNAPAIDVETVKVEEPRISAEGPGELDYYHLTHKEKLYIAKTVYKEARGECFEGQVAVAAVVLNRYTSDDPFFKNDSIYSVVTQYLQFAEGVMEVTEEQLAQYPSCMEAVEMAVKGWDPTRKVFEEGAKFFFEPELITSKYQKQIREGIEKLIIGNHHFHNDFNE